MTKDFKSIFSSKTFYLGIIQLSIAILQYAQGQIEVGATLTFLGIATIILRFFTNTKVQI